MNSQRARVVMVRPFSSAASAVQGRTGIAEAESGPSTHGPASDDASIAKVAVPVGIAGAFTAQPLKNGMRVEAARHGTLPLVSVGLAFRAGTAEEGVTGAAALANLLADAGRPRYGRFGDVGALFSQSMGATRSRRSASSCSRGTSSAR